MAYKMYRQCKKTNVKKLTSTNLTSATLQGSVAHFSDRDKSSNIIS